jgi:hypothetical protein
MKNDDFYRALETLLRHTAIRLFPLCKIMRTLKNITRRHEKQICVIPACEKIPAQG